MPFHLPPVGSTPIEGDLGNHLVKMAGPYNGGGLDPGSLFSGVLPGSPGGGAHHPMQQMWLGPWISASSRGLTGRPKVGY